MKVNKNLMIVLGGIMFAMLFVFGAFIYVSGLRAYAQGSALLQRVKDDKVQLRVVDNTSAVSRAAGCGI